MTATPPKSRLARPIALVGLMGCGKTTVGGRVARLLNAPFRDADAEIVEAAGLTIPEIFEKHGEAEFRRGEERVIARLLTEEPMILATGGGAFMSPVTRAAIRAAGGAVWLHADLETLLERTGRRDTRPLLKNGDPREILSGLMELRYPVYAEADIRVESTLDGSADDVAKSIVAALEAHDENAPDTPFLKAPV